MSDPAEQDWRNAAGAWYAAGQQAHACVADVALQLVRPSTVHRPRLFVDGDQWCALYGDNLQDGVAGFGDSPEKAFVDFDRRWAKPLGPGE